MYCKNCFRKISSESRFCKYCGAPVDNKRRAKQESLQSPEPIKPIEPEVLQEEHESAAVGEPAAVTESAAEQEIETMPVPEAEQEPEEMSESEAEPEPASVSESETAPKPSEVPESAEKTVYVKPLESSAAAEHKRDYKFKLRSEKAKEFPLSPKFIRIGIAVILLIAMIAVFMNSSLFQSPDSINYNDYIGVWQERGVEDVESSGGVRLEILEVDGGTMVLSMGFYDGGAAYNGIEVENIGAVIKDGSAYYTFSNDGYGNSGNGVLTFKGRDIQWKSVINKEDANHYTVSKVKNSVDNETTEPKEESEEAKETSKNKADDDYILPDSADTYLTEEDLKDLTQEELRIARNEIMARHGRIFNDPALAAYFESKDWYNGTIDPETFDSQTSSELNEYEMKNIALIQSME